MELTKNQTYQLLYNRNKREAISAKYRFTTKFKWWCLRCLKVIYVSYKQYGITAIVCPDCKSLTMKNPTIIQSQYLRILKEKQALLIEQLIDK